MTKNPPGHGTTCVTTQLYQGISIDFSFSGMTSDDSEIKNIYKEINGENCWISITDNFTGMKHGDARITKASPIAWLRNFLNHYYPNCNDNYINLDQWDVLLNSSDVKELLQ